MFKKLFCQHEYKLIAEDTTVYIRGDYYLKAPVQFYMCKKCGKIKRVVIK